MARGVKVEVPSVATARRGSKRSSIDEMPPSSSAATIVDEDTPMGDAQHHQSNGKYCQGAASLLLSSTNIRFADQVIDISKGYRVEQSNGGTAAHIENSSDTLESDSDAGLELLGRGMKAFVTLIPNLRDLGVEELVLPLPKICVLGDQSTGKSSLIEGISGIKVPRNVGTCTRCPLEINLTASEPGTSWKCTISLYKRYIYEGLPVTSPFGKTTAGKPEGATRARPLGPWLLQSTPEKLPFFRTSKKADIPRALHLAQLATLNPGSDHTKFLPGKANVEERMQVKFSPNVVTVDISAPDVPNLSFYDLPGVINQAEIPEEEYLVKLVANLVKSYIQNENCINLLAMPMTDDAANSTASKLVQEMHAQNRTIGVLTKPDRVQHGESLSQWVDVLNGHKFRLGHGYYVVKNNPNPDVSHAVARQEEEEFFGNEELWARQLASHRDRFGTFKLQGVLSKRLTAQIRTSLPQITERVRAKTSEVIARLGELPEAPKGNLTLKVFEKLLIFENELRKQLDDGSEEHPFHTEWHATAERFCATIADSYPRLSLSDPLMTAQTPSRMAYRLSATPVPSLHRSEIIAVDSDEDGGITQQYTPTPKSKRKQPVTKSFQSSPPKRSRLGDIPQYEPARDGMASRLDSPSTNRTTAAVAAPHARRFTLTEIRNILQDAHVSLPNQIDPKATQKMIRESLLGWDSPLEEFMNFTKETCLAMILQKVSHTFGTWRGTQLFELVEEVCSSFLREHSEKQLQSARRALSLERQKPSTLQKRSMQTASDKASDKLNTACRKERARALLAKVDPDWDHNLTSHAMAEKISKVTDAQLGPNPYFHELRALSDVRGYYECAYSRFVDNIYQGIEAELFSACRTELRTTLTQRIGLEEQDAKQRCAVLLAVDPEAERIRLELTKQKENLEKASAWLESQ